MIKKRTAVILVLITLLLTSAATFTVGNLYSLRVGDKIVLTQEDFQRYQAFYDEYAKVDELKEYIKRTFYEPVEDETLDNGAIKGIFEHLGDPYSTYMTPEEFEAFNEESEGTYGGIGIVVTATEDGLITVVSPIEDTPGDAAGIKSGDKIIMVDDVDVWGDELDAAVDRMKGEPGTDVVLTILRDREELTFTITREQIVIKSVKSRMIDDQIGYLRISSFDNKVHEEFVNHLGQLMRSGAEGLVIDLRNNPGGSLEQVVYIADDLVGNGSIVYTRDRSGKEEHYESDPEKIDLPIVVLVNEGSASASEILTAALRDLANAKIIGTTTFGKGVVQTIRPLADGSAVKLTTSQYFTPSGDYIHGVGIPPDIEVTLDPAYDEIEEPTDADDNQLQRALEELRSHL